MAVRLNKALKELNVGINTVAEFLQKKAVCHCNSFSFFAILFTSNQRMLFEIPRSFK